MNKGDFKEVFQKFGSPCYIYDLNVLEDHMKNIRNKIGNKIQLCYAIKANPLLIEYIDSYIDRIEVCSPGEMQICIKKHIDPCKILMSGINKQREDIRNAIEYGVRMFSAESKKQIRLLSDVAEKLQVHIEVYGRLNAESQFGMSDIDFESVIAERKQLQYCSIQGLHYFVGTQRRGEKQKKDIARLNLFMSRIRTKYDFTFSEIEYGPGLYVPYFEEEDVFSYGQLDALNTLLSEWNQYKLTIELGRYLVASCGYYITSVVDKKTVSDTNYLIVDGGINQVSYYGSNMGLRTPKLIHIPLYKEKKDNYDEKEWTICGSLCTTADVLVRSKVIKGVRDGDILCFENVGAYSATESLALFLSRDIPKIVVFDGNSIIKVRDSIMSSSINIAN